MLRPQDPAAYDACPPGSRHPRVQKRGPASQDGLGTRPDMPRGPLGAEGQHAPAAGTVQPPALRPGGSGLLLRNLRQQNSHYPRGCALLLPAKNPLGCL